MNTSFYVLPCLKNTGVACVVSRNLVFPLSDFLKSLLCSDLMMKLRTNSGLLSWFPDILVAVPEVYMQLAGLESDQELGNHREFTGY